MSREVEVRELGLKDYKETWDYQEKLFKEVLDIKISNRRNETHAQTPNFFLLVEHPHVYTLGKSGKPEHLLLNEVQLKERNASFYKINRGGDITYHGPGQVVGYPILDLENFFTDIHKYLALSGRSDHSYFKRIWFTTGTQQRRNGSLAGCGNAVCAKDLRHGSSRQPLGDHARICLKCKCRFRLFR